MWGWLLSRRKWLLSLLAIGYLRRSKGVAQPTQDVPDDPVISVEAHGPVVVIGEGAVKTIPGLPNEVREIVAGEPVPPIDGTGRGILKVLLESRQGRVFLFSGGRNSTTVQIDGNRRFFLVQDKLVAVDGKQVGIYRAVKVPKGVHELHLLLLLWNAE